MKKIIILSLILSGCNWSDLGEIQDYVPLNENIEQKNSSETSPDGLSTNYPQNCTWTQLERVVDGDTIIVQDGADRVRVRMIGIDTPESKRAGTAIQAHALDATRELQNLLTESDKVCLIQDKIGDQYDIYNRRLSYVLAEDGLDLNAEMLRQGWAKAYLRFPFERKEAFAALERTAKQAAVGRWEY